MVLYPTNMKDPADISHLMQSEHESPVNIPKDGGALVEKEHK